MKKYLVGFLFGLLIGQLAFSLASPPSRQNTYTSGSAINASDVTDNEDAIFNYLQAGVDTIKDGTIVNADINSSANIQSDKINLTSIAQNISNTGTLTNTGAFTNTGNVTFVGTLAVSSGGSDGKAVCWNGTTLGYCSDQPDENGGCTCN
jgi:hypothetical protein